MKRNKKIVPALMFHSVGLEKHPWAWSHISEPLKTFEAKIALLRDKGFNGIFWHELYEYMAGRVTLPENSILLTFDDGYLDNWVYVFPILRKYGMKGTIFVTPDFVDPGNSLRPNLDDVKSGACDSNELQVPGFLNWAEMREMEKSGVIDVQSHAMTHTWYFSGPRIADFHRPHDIAPYPWLLWNARPDRKPYYLSEDQQKLLPWGYPILEHQKSLEARRFFPDQTAIHKITDFVAEHGGQEFFKTEEWRNRLNRFTESQFANGKLPGRFESNEDRIDRITFELKQSKALIERHLDKSVEFICWPGGANTAAVHEIARNVGFKAWTLSSMEELEKRNRQGADPISIRRIGTSNVIKLKGKRCGLGGARYQYLKILSHQGSAAHSIALRIYKLGALAASLGGLK